jgi:hypothetical protein
VPVVLRLEVLVAEAARGDHDPHRLSFDVHVELPLPALDPCDRVIEGELPSDPTDMRDALGGIITIDFGDAGD